MNNSRYEEHVNTSQTLPLIINGDIKRDKENCAEQANWHENLEIQLITEGEGFVLLDGQSLSVKEGDIVVANSKVIHYTGTETALTYTCLIMDSQFLIESGIDVERVWFVKLFRDKEIQRKILQLRDIYGSEDILKVAKVRQKLLSIMIELRERFTLEVSKQVNHSKYYQVIKQCIKYIRQNYQRKITLDELSKKVFIDKFTLSREFKKLTNHTVIEYVNLYRCKRAAEGLSMNKSVFETALDCGFNNMSFFTKTFKNFMGCLPSKFKKKY